MDNSIQEWAEALLAFPNLRIVVVDTTSIKKDADVIHFLTLDKHGSIDAAFFIKSRRYPGMLNTEWTGITPLMMEHKGRGLPLLAFWPKIVNALTGYFVVAYGFDFIQEHLDENAEFYGLPKVCLVGDDLMEKAPAYFRSTSYNIKLIDACSRIGHVLPARPTAEQRARGQLALLKAMAEGITSPQKPVDEDKLGDLDTHPF